MNKVTGVEGGYQSFREQVLLLQRTKFGSKLSSSRGLQLSLLFSRAAALVSTDSYMNKHAYTYVCVKVELNK